MSPFVNAAGTGQAPAAQPAPGITPRPGLRSASDRIRFPRYSGLGSVKAGFDVASYSIRNATDQDVYISLGGTDPQLLGADYFDELVLAGQTLEDLWTSGERRLWWKLDSPSAAAAGSLLVVTLWSVTLAPGAN